MTSDAVHVGSPWLFQSHTCTPFQDNKGTMESLPVNNKTVGEPESLKNKVLETGASAVQVIYHNYLLQCLLSLICSRTSPPCSESAPISTRSTPMPTIPSAAPSKQTTTVHTSTTTCGNAFCTTHRRPQRASSVLVCRRFNLGLQTSSSQQQST